MSTTYRQYTCTKANVINIAYYDDDACTEESDQEPLMDTIERGVCTPLPLRQGGPGRNGPPGGQGGRGGGDGGNRRLQGGRTNNSQGNQRGPGMGNNGGSFLCSQQDNDDTTNFGSVMDTLTDLTCLDSDGSGSGGGDSFDDNPCVGLQGRQCQSNDECDWQNRVCVWQNAPEGQQNLYVVYEWRYVTIDGEKTEDEYCYSGLESDSITDKTSHNLMLEGLVDTGVITDKKVCKSYGGKYKKNKGSCTSKMKKCKVLVPDACEVISGCSIEVNEKNDKTSCTGKPDF